MFRKSGIVIVSLFFILSSYQAAAEEKALSLEEASRVALENNFDIQLTKYDIQISRQDIDEAKSIYDTVFSVEVGYGEDKTAKNSTLFASHTASRSVSAGVSKSFPTGTEVAVTHETSRGWNDPATGTSYNPGYDSSFSVTVDQDLGRNFFGLQDRGNVKVSMRDVENATFLSLDKIEQTLADVQKSYWALVLASDLYDIEQEFLEQSKRLYEIDQEQIKNGLVEKPQVLGSEANYQQRWSGVLVARDNLETQENVLKLQLNISEDQDIVLKPSETFQDIQYTVSLQHSLQKAFENRRDYLQAMNEIERRDILLSIKKNATWPQINLEASFARNGLDDSYGDAFKKIFDEDNPEFSTSLSFSMPLENRDATADVKRAEFEKAKALIKVKYLERKIAIAIVDQVRKCEIFYERLVSLNKAADLQTKKAEEQEKIFRQGRSDSDTVIRFQEDAISARSQAARAYFDYYAALIDLKKQEGTLLSEHWDGEI